MPSKSNTVLVLDLDDTLYKEADYVRSGLNHVAELVRRMIGSSVLSELLQFRERSPDGDVLGFVCQAAGLPASVKESLLWAYRLHYPDIRLQPEIRQWLDKSQSEYCAIAILTDGRSVTQRIKLQTLGLENIPAYISEEWASTKPDQKRYVAIQERWQAKRYVYVGDNIVKDFLAPNRLHWTTVGLLDSGQNIHAQQSQSSNLSSGTNEAMSQPNIWVRSLLEIDNIFT